MQAELFQKRRLILPYLVFDIQQKTFTILAIQVQLSDDFIIIKNIQ